EPVDPYREISRTVGDDGICRQMRCEMADHDRHVDTLTRAFLRHGHEMLVLAPCRVGPRPPWWRFDGRDLREAFGRRRRRGDDRQIGLVNTAKFIRIGMD